MQSGIEGSTIYGGGNGSVYGPCYVLIVCSTYVCVSSEDVLLRFSVLCAKGTRELGVCTV